MKRPFLLALLAGVLLLEASSLEEGTSEWYETMTPGARELVAEGYRNGLYAMSRLLAVELSRPRVDKAQVLGTITAIGPTVFRDLPLSGLEEMILHPRDPATWQLSVCQEIYTIIQQGGF